MLINLLDSASSSATQTSDPWGTFIMIGFFAVLIVVMMVLNRRSQKKREEEAKKILDNLKPGNTVMTIGHIHGTVVEVCGDGKFVLETGTEKSGKSYLMFDTFAIAQTDAVPASSKEVPAEEPVEEAPVEENAETENE